MNAGNSILIEFPFTNLFDSKVRLAVVINITPDIYQDVIVCRISLVVPVQLNHFQLIIQPTQMNSLRSVSVVYVYRIATVANTKMTTSIGRLSEEELQTSIVAFQSLTLS